MSVDKVQVSQLRAREQLRRWDRSAEKVRTVHAEKEEAWRLQLARAPCLNDGSFLAF